MEYSVYVLRMIHLSASSAMFDFCISCTNFEPSYVFFITCESIFILLPVHGCAANLLSSLLVLCFQRKRRNLFALLSVWGFVQIILLALAVFIFSVEYFVLTNSLLSKWEGGCADNLSCCLLVEGINFIES